MGKFLNLTESARHEIKPGHEKLESTALATASSVSVHSLASDSQKKDPSWPVTKRRWHNGSYTGPVVHDLAELVPMMDDFGRARG